LPLTQGGDDGLAFFSAIEQIGHRRRLKPILGRNGFDLGARLGRQPIDH
jgi:hypothetical protein